MSYTFRSVQWAAYKLHAVINFIDVEETLTTIFTSFTFRVYKRVSRRINSSMTMRRIMAMTCGE